jgi:enolase-phosphatase E1
VIEFSGQGILLDIEGTTSSVRFVYDVMFPFARRELDRFLEEHADRSDVVEACDLVAREVGYCSLADWSPEPDLRRAVIRDEVNRLMDVDSKSTGLKQLQGLIWQSGFASGELLAHVYDDVVPALEDWTRRGKDIRIYSSGSVQAQRLFFEHTVHGDLRRLFQGYYDTTVGPKRAPESYSVILEDYRLPAPEVLFLSDVPAELDAAKQAGLATGWCVRNENVMADVRCDHSIIRTFAEVRISG